jgi:hypothetical protein
MRMQDVVSKKGAIDLQHPQTEQQAQEVPIIPSSETIVNPRTMMIGFCDAAAAETAVFAPCWFQEVASAADGTGVEEDVVVGIVLEARREVG